jgi:hypothetical protein
VEEQEKISWQNYEGIIVLCELKWSHETENGNYSDLNGIKLIQHYIRFDKQIKLPVLFVSMLSRNGEHPLTKVTLITAYKEFTAIIEQTYLNKEKSSAFFMFTHAHIELLQIQKDCNNSDAKKIWR